MPRDLSLTARRAVKRCLTCRQEFPRTEFHGDKSRTDGISPHCKACARARGSAWYQRNKAAQDARSDAWRRAHPERARRLAADRQKRHYQRNRAAKLEREKRRYVAVGEKIRAAARERYWRAPEVRRQAALEWARLNPGAARARAKARHARKRGAGVHDFTDREWATMLARHGGRCVYCGRTDRITQDHLTPLCRGGDHTESNIVPACLSCNSSKGRRTLAEFLSA